MSTEQRPEQLRNKEQIENAKRQAQEAEALKGQVMGLLNLAIKAGRVTSEGGKFSSTGHWPQKNIEAAKQILKEIGWQCEHSTSQETAWSMSAKSEYEYTEHTFNLRPISK